jgi:uncharacterized membrane protein
MIQLVIGLILFLGVHSVSIFAASFRNRMAARSELGWKAVYGLLSLAGLVLIVRGYAQARLDPVWLYVPAPWLKHVAALLMLPVFTLFLAPYLPGKIKAVTKHPQLTAVKLWATAHLLANGTLADVLLFGAFLAWAVVDRISMKRRSPREVSPIPASARNDVILVIAGLAIYVVFAFWLHVRWIGVAPFG